MAFNIYQKTGKTVLPAFQSNEKINDPALYMPSDALVDAVNVALNLGQPLLLTGEPGTGKTQLAYHLAHQFGLDKPLIFNAQTTSTATDLFYKYDALGHFQYNQNNSDPLSMDDLERRFVHYNALGDAIRQQRRVVVLIDEIDKAPRDLPNDVLFAIEKLSFKVPELNNKPYDTIPAARPIIIITSNSEKNLPDAFLRRVIYYHIPFPSEEDLIKILSAKTDGFTEGGLRGIVQHFNEIRGLKLKKLPATSELIYWALLLKQTDFPMDKLEKADFSKEEKAKLVMSYAVLAKTKEDLEVLKSNL